MKQWKVRKRFPRGSMSGIVPPRRPVVAPLPRLSLAAARRVMRELLAHLGVQGYDDVVPGEMKSRPAPHLVDVPPTASALREAYKEVLPIMYSQLDLSYPLQTYNKVSRMGWPFFYRSPEKARFVESAFADFKRQGVATLRGCYTVMNVRLQPEPADKTRSFQFISEGGESYESQVGPSERTLSLSDGTKGLSQRTRLVFVYPVFNLVAQIADTMFNNALTATPVCKHNMFALGNASDVLPYYVAFDVKHMERNTAIIASVRTQMIGGAYQVLHEAMEEGGYLQPQDDWQACYGLKGPPNGMLVQYGSGHSAVSVSQKEMVLTIVVRWHVEVHNMTLAEAVRVVLSNTSPYIRLKNYGDDNFVSSHEAKHLDSLLAFLSTYLPIEVDPTHTFLGQSYDGKRFTLRPLSYVLRTYLSERAPGGAFRKLPWLGWKLRREAYLFYGDARKMTTLFDLEDRLLEEEGYAYDEIERRAAEESEGAPVDAVSNVGYTLLFGKDYLLTSEEKLATDTYDGIGPVESKQFLDDLCVSGPLMRFWSESKGPLELRREDIALQEYVDKLRAASAAKLAENQEESEEE